MGGYNYFEARIMNKRGLKSLFSERQLSQLFQACLKIKKEKSDIENFAALQCDIIQEHFSDFRYDLCTTSLVETCSDGSPVTIESYLYNFNAPKDEVLASYYAVANEDPISQLIFLNPGWALSHKDVFLGAIDDEPLYQKHTKKFGASKSISIGFNVPLFHDFFLSFDYLGYDDNLSWEKFNPETLEWASFPFALAWLYLTGRIGKVVLGQHLKSVSGLSLSQLNKLQVYIQHQDKRLSKQAEILNISPAHYKKSLYELRDIILYNFDDHKSSEKIKELAALQPYCQLLKMMRDRTKPFQYIDGRGIPDYFKHRLKKRCLTSYKMAQI